MDGHEQAQGCASLSHGARLVRLIITMIKWIRTSRLSIKNTLSAGAGMRVPPHDPRARPPPPTRPVLHHPPLTRDRSAARAPPLGGRGGGGEEGGGGGDAAGRDLGQVRERVPYWQPTGPNPLNHRDDFSRPALRHGSLNFLLQVALYLPS